MPRELEQDRFITRTQYNTIPPTVEYSLAEGGNNRKKAEEGNNRKTPLTFFAFPFITRTF